MAGYCPAGMKAHPRAPMVQLSALLCLVPLALNHGDMQVQPRGCGRSQQRHATVMASVLQLSAQNPPCVCGHAGQHSAGLPCVLHSAAAEHLAMMPPCAPPPSSVHPGLQMKVARLCLPSILAAIQQNPAEFEVVAKGLILLGVLGQASSSGNSSQLAVQACVFACLLACLLLMVLRLTMG